MPESEKQQLEKAIWPTVDKEKEMKFFGGNAHAIKDSRDNYCFWMTAFKHESLERLRELKEINEAKFNFCRQRYIANEREVIKEQLREGGLISF